MNLISWAGIDILWPLYLYLIDEYPIIGACKWEGGLNQVLKGLCEF